VAFIKLLNFLPAKTYRPKCKTPKHAKAHKKPTAIIHWYHPADKHLGRQKNKIKNMRTLPGSTSKLPSR